MISVIKALSSVLNIYMMIIFIRILLTWFSWTRSGGIQDFLARITDPYLNWFRRFSFLRIGFLDLSPIVALGVLSLVIRILSTMAFYGKISLGIILALIIQAAWGAISFILGFLIIVLIVRLIAILFRLNSDNTFWRIVETLSQPVLYRISRLIFGNRIVNMMTALIISVSALGITYLLLRFLFAFLTGMLVKMPF